MELPSDDILNISLKCGLLGIFISGALIALFLIASFFSIPAWLTALCTGLFVGASVYLTAILYGVINDLFATHANLPYFLLGHQPQQTSLLKTNDKVVQGIGWGVAASFGPAALAAFLFTIAIAVIALFTSAATFLMPLFMILISMVAFGTEIYAQQKAKEYATGAYDLSQIGANSYQELGNAYMCRTQEQRATWYATGARNSFGFIGVPIIGVVLLASLICISFVDLSIPSWLFSSFIYSTLLPVICAAVVCIGLIAAGIYMQINRNKQVDNRYRLEFDVKKVIELYLDEDKDHVLEIVGKYKPKLVESINSLFNKNNQSTLAAEDIRSKLA